MGLDALDLARIQFGFTISFHIIFSATTIGLASYLAVIEALWLMKGDQVYRELYHYWKKIFAVNFAMGVVSGLVMAYQFGTNWGRFSLFTGGIVGPLMSYEVLTAFFLEAGFLGVMLFGWNKVGRGLHFLATLLVAFGTLVSATWILASNSWMNTPSGFEIIDGRAVPTDWLKVIFNPSFPYRLMHMTVGSYLACALIVGAAGAWHLLKQSEKSPISMPAVRKMFAMAMGMLLAAAPLQILLGDLHGLNTLAYQPEKVAAMEGHWENQPGEGVPLRLFGWPDTVAEKTLYSVEIPSLGSLILTHSWDGQIPSLKDFPIENRPNVPAVFWAFRVMVGLGVLMLFLGVWALFSRMRGRLYQSKALFWMAYIMGPSGVIAILAGWFTTEIGRQPWVVHGVLKTSDAVSNHSAPILMATLLAFIVLYFSVFGVGIRYMLRIIRKGPVKIDDATAIESTRLARLLSTGG